MGILSKKEFADSMNISYDTVKKNAQRGNIIKGTKGKIDTDNPTNKLFFDKQMVQNSVNVPKEKKTQTKKGTVKAEKVVEKPTGLTKIQKEYAEIELRKKLADLDLVERSAELKKIQLEKSAGNLLPVDLVSTIFSINIQSIFKTLDADIDNMASLYVNRFGGTSRDLAEISEQMRIELSKSIEKCKENASVEIENAVNEFQDIKGRGER